MDANRGADIDDEEDLRLAELLVLGLTARDGWPVSAAANEGKLFSRGKVLRDKMICTIPARGGSKRLARKNLRKLAGKPLIAYSIEAALETGLFSDRSTFAPKTPRSRGPQFNSVPSVAGARAPRNFAEIWLRRISLPIYLRRGYPGASRLTRCCVCSQVLHCRYEAHRISSMRSRNSSARTVRLPGQRNTIGPPRFSLGSCARRKVCIGGCFSDRRYLKERPLLPPVYRPNGSIKIAELSVLSATETSLESGSA